MNEEHEKHLLSCVSARGSSNSPGLSALKCDNDTHALLLGHASHLSSGIALLWSGGPRYAEVEPSSQKGRNHLHLDRTFEALLI